MNPSAHRASDPSYRSILVPLDGSHHAGRVLPAARALAARFDATIHTVTVASSDFDLDRIRAEAAQVLGTEADDPRIHVDIDTDVAGAVYRRAADLDSLVCLSTHGRGRVAGTVIGSTTREIIERGPEPVVVVGSLVVRRDPGSETAMLPLGIDHLVACVDGSPASESGLPIAAAWANALGMKLTIVTVAEPCPPPVRIGAPWRRHHGPNEDADGYVARLGEKWALEIPGLDTVVVYDPIGVAAGMHDYLAANPAGMVVVTSRVRDRFARMVFGSGAADIVRASTVPVLVVPAREEEV